MIITKEQQDDFAEVSKPLIKWLNDNCHPHCSVFITPVSAELNEGIAIIPTREYLKD